MNQRFHEDGNEDESWWLEDKLNGWWTSSCKINRRLVQLEMDSWKEKDRHKDKKWDSEGPNHSKVEEKMDFKCCEFWIRKRDETNLNWNINKKRSPKNGELVLSCNNKGFPRYVLNQLIAEHHKEELYCKWRKGAQGLFIWPLAYS